MSTAQNRRTFLKSVTLTSSLFTIVPSTALGLENKISANNHIQVGSVGVGSRGTSVMKGFLRNKHCQVVAICDVKKNVLKEKKDFVNRYYESSTCESYSDFRNLMAREDIDAVMVATCDHWHVLCALEAVRCGKDIYVEKPLGLTFEEDQTLRKAIQKNNRIFQFGTQQRSDPKFQLACQLARSGKLGDIHTINVWSPGSEAGGDPTPKPVPDWIDYHFWLGPAPYKPYTQDRCSNDLWWFISDYALGFIAGWGIHPMDIAYWGAPDKFQGPWIVSGTGTFPKEGVADTALNWQVNIKLGSGTHINFHGNPYPDEWKKRYEDESSHGTAFEGTEGWVYVRRGKINASAKSLLDTRLDFPLGSDEYQNSTNNHVDNFLNSVRNRNQPLSEINDSVKADALCHISDIAIRLKRELTFDPKTERFLNDDHANGKLLSFMRDPWHL